MEFSRSPTPTRKQLETRVSLLEVVVGAVSASVIVAVILNAVDLSAEHLRFSLFVIAFIVPLSAICSTRFKRKYLEDVLLWVDAHHRGTEEADDRSLVLSAFEQIANFPFRCSVYAAISWFVCGLPVGLCFPLIFDDFGWAPGSILMGGIVCMSFIAVCCDYLGLKQILFTTRQALVARLPDPEERAGLVRSIPIRTRLIVMMSAFMMLTAYTMSVFTTSRSGDQLKLSMAARQQRVLDQFVAEVGQSGKLPVLTPQTAELLDGMGMNLSIFDPQQREATVGWDGFDNTARDLLVAATDSAGAVVNNNSIYVASYRRLGEDGLLFVASGSYEVFQETMEAGAYSIALLVAFIVGGGIFVAVVLARDIEQGLLVMENKLERIAEGDLAGAPAFDSEDEIGRLSRSADLMQASLRSIVEDMARAATELNQTGTELDEVAQQVGQASDGQNTESDSIHQAATRVSTHVSGLASLAQNLEDSTKESSSAVFELQTMGVQLEESGGVLKERATESMNSLQQMSQGSQRVAAGADSLDAVVGDATADLSRVLAAIEEVGQNARLAAEQSTQVVSIAQQGRENADSTLVGMQEIEAASNDLSASFDRLGAAGASIGQIAGVIGGVADESNLLALNAAIIAAQAGEQGRAFSVVAAQIKELANGVRSNTDSIQELISNLASNTDEARAALARSTERVSAGLRLAATSRESLEAITAASQNSGDRTVAIVDAMSRQTEATERLASLMEQVRQEVNAIRQVAHDHHEGSRFVMEQSGQVSEVASELERATSEQAANARHIAHGIEQVHTGTSEMNAALAEQRAACDALSGSVKNLRSAASAERESYERLREATARLHDQAAAFQASVSRFRLD